LLGKVFTLKAESGHLLTSAFGRVSAPKLPVEMLLMMAPST